MIDIYEVGKAFVRKEVTPYALKGIYNKDRWHGWTTGLEQVHLVAMASVMVDGVDSKGDTRPEDR